MEKREEIKDGVKQRLIEFMAEQITREESFLDLKQEVINEFLTKKNIKTQVVEKTTESLFNTFENMVKEKTKRFEFNREEFAKRINDIKTGKEKVDLKTFLEETGNYSDTHKDVLEMLERDQKLYTAENFDDPKLKYHFSNENIEKIREIGLQLINKIANNPIQSDEFYKFEIKSFFNGGNSYRTYELTNKLEKFRFFCSFVYNKEKEERYIDRLFIDSAGLLVANDDLGIPFAIQAMEIMDRAYKQPVETPLETTEINTATSESEDINDKVLKEIHQHFKGPEQNTTEGSGGPF